jgi:hypothetical protein
MAQEAELPFAPIRLAVGAALRIGRAGVGLARALLLIPVRAITFARGIRGLPQTFAPVAPIRRVPFEITCEWRRRYNSFRRAVGTMIPELLKSRN